jgi:hypothetical protein
MDYKKIYDKIIEHRISNPLDKNVYSENHHIIPRSLGGSDDKINLVKLTAREHFVCHLLLSEIYPKDTFKWYKMNHAFLMMCSTGLLEKRYVNSRIYELKKKDFSIAMSWNSKGEKNSQFGKEKNVTTKEKIKKTLLEFHGSKDGLTVKERKIEKTKKEKEIFTYDGVFFGLQRRNKLFEVFSIDVTNEFNTSILQIVKKLEHLYLEEKKSTVTIAKELNSDSETIRNYLNIFKIPVRSLSESIKISHIKNGCSSVAEHLSPKQGVGIS